MKKVSINYIRIIRRYEIIIASSIGIIAVVYLSFRLLFPNFMRAQEIYSEQKQLSGKLSVLKVKDNDLATVDGSFYKDALAKITKVLPQDKDYVSIFESLDNFQTKTGVTILRADFQLGNISTNSASLKKDTSSPAYIVPITLEVIGGMPQISRFIESLSDLSGRLFTVDDTSFAIRPDGLIQGSFNGKAYFYPLPTTIGSVDSPLASQSSEIRDILTSVSKNVVISGQEGGNVPMGKKNLFE